MAYSHLLYIEVSSLLPQQGTQFVKACYELNGKPFTYENLSKLKGYILLETPTTREYFPLEEEYIADIAKGEDIVDGSGQKKTFNKKVPVVGTHGIQIAEDQSLKDHWVCYASFSDRFLETYSYAKFFSAF